MTDPSRSVTRLRLLGRCLALAANPWLTQHLLTLRDQSELLAHPLRHGTSCAVVGVEPGGGRTTVAALLASLLADYGTGRVLAVDTDTTSPALRIRLGAGPGGSWNAVLAGLRLEAPGQMTMPMRGPAGFRWIHNNLARAEGLDLLAVAPHEHGRTLEGRLYVAALTRLGRWYRAIVTDTPVGTGIMPGVLSRADRLIVVGTLTPGGLSAMHTFLQRIHAVRPLMTSGFARCVVVQPEGGANVNVERIRENLGLPMHVIPRDPALEHGQPLRWGMLRETTRRAALEMATSTVAGFLPASIPRRG